GNEPSNRMRAGPRTQGTRRSLAGRTRSHRRVVRFLRQGASEVTMGGGEAREKREVTRRRLVHVAARVGASLRLGQVVRDGMGILMYHRVTPLPQAVSRPTWNVTPERLRRQLGGLLDRGYRPWPLRKALEESRAGRPLAPMAFVVTFDDGYENVYHYAWPILRELGIPATIF